MTGIFETGHYARPEFFRPIHVGQELYGLGDSLHGITVRTVDPYGAERVKQEIQKFLEPPQYAQTWIDMNNQFFEAVRLERTVMFFLLFFIIIVAAFGIMNTLITVTVQKTRDIGVMKAIGANITQIVGVFLGQGIIVGFFGTLMGLGLGMTLVQYRNEFSHWLSSTFGFEVFPKQVYQFSQLPAQVVPVDVAKICIGAFLICCVFAFLPALRAARLDPVKAFAMNDRINRQEPTRPSHAPFCGVTTLLAKSIASPVNPTPEVLASRYGLHECPGGDARAPDILKHGGNAIDAAAAPRDARPDGTGLERHRRSLAIVYSAKETNSRPERQRPPATRRATNR